MADDLRRFASRHLVPDAIARPPAVRLRGARADELSNEENGDRSSLFDGVRGRRRAATTAGDTRRPPPIEEETSTVDGETGGNLRGRIAGRRRAFSNAVATRLGFGGGSEEVSDPEAARIARERAQYDRQVIDLLDVMDPEVSTLSTLSDLQNSLFVPNLGRFVNRESYLRLSKPPEPVPQPQPEPPKKSKRFWRRLRKERLPSVPEEKPRPRLTLADGETPVQARGKYLILPEGLVDWEEWTDQEREELDDYVRHLLHSRKWKARRTLRGFGHYVRTPLGAFVTIYASLLTIFGAAWFFFLIGWINAGSQQAYFIEIIDQILVALFCLVGLGLAPFRAVDTYHMIFIARYHRKTLRLYREQGLPPLPDENDLPDPTARPALEQEDHIRPPVLSVKEQATFLYHQSRFARSHTFARFHETQTHKAFPLDLLIVVVCLLDCHSLFQLALGSATWSISYHRSFKRILTTVILSFSISCNITAGLVIVIGNRRTRKKQILKELFRKSITEEAVRRRERKRQEQRLAEEADREHRRQNSLPPPLDATSSPNPVRQIASR